VSDTIAVGSRPYSVAFRPYGTQAYVANGGSDTVSVINVATGDVTDTIGVGDVPRSVAFSPNGEKAYVANANGNSVSVIVN
jgi:YVTN family beta-propeller protein